MISFRATVQKSEARLKAYLRSGGWCARSLRGWEGGCNICYVHSVQDSAVIVKHWGEMHPPRAPVLMCLACTELSLSTSLHLKPRRCKAIAHTEYILMIQIIKKIEKLLQ